MSARRFFLVPLLFALTSCGTATSTSGVAEPHIEIQQLSRLPAGVSRDMTGGIPVEFEIEVTNEANEPIRLVRVNLQSIGIGAYTLNSATRPFDTNIDPSKTEHVRTWVPATIEMLTAGGGNGPVTLRVTAEFDTASGKHFQSVAVRTVSAGGE